jgi:uncharacterized phiE125 gp8 family phage protein
MIVTQTTPPAYLPLTTAEAKLHLRVDGTDEDALIAAFIGAAVDTCQQITGRSLMAQAWKLTVDDFADEIALPWPQVQAVQAVQYKDADGATQTLASLVYELTGDKVCLVPGQEWPAVRGGSGSVWISYTAGYSAGNEAAQQAAVPYGIKAWLLLTIGGTLYANRESVQTGVSVASLPDRFADSLLDRFKVY